MSPLWLALALSAVPGAPAIRLEVPIVRQAPERCGPAALAMVMRFYGADSSAIAIADRAYDPQLHGSLITDLAAAARAAGFTAEVERYSDSLVVAGLANGTPPIVLYQNGSSVITVPHYGVVVAWDPAADAFTLHDGGAKPHRMRRADLAARARVAGGRALIVRRSP